MVDIIWIIVLVVALFIVFAVVGRWLGRRRVTGPPWGVRTGSIVQESMEDAYAATNARLAEEAAERAADAKKRAEHLADKG